LAPQQPRKVNTSSFRKVLAESERALLSV